MSDTQDTDPVRGDPPALTPAHHATIGVAKEFMRVLGDAGMDERMTHWHPDGVLGFPFLPEDSPHPARVEGKDAVGASFGNTGGCRGDA